MTRASKAIFIATNNRVVSVRLNGRENWNINHRTLIALWNIIMSDVSWGILLITIIIDNAIKWELPRKTLQHFKLLTLQIIVDYLSYLIGQFDRISNYLLYIEADESLQEKVHFKIAKTSSSSWNGKLCYQQADNIDNSSSISCKRFIPIRKFSVPFSMLL